MTDIQLSETQKLALEKLAASSIEALQRRALIVLAYDAGQPTQAVASEVGLSHSQTRYWRRQFVRHGMAIFPPTSKPSRKQKQPAVPVIALPEPETALAITELPQAEIAPRLADIPLPQPMQKPGIDRADTLAEAGRKTLLFHFAEMLRHEPGTRQGDDIEALHDMRVATRRMRAAFDVFGEAFEPEALKRHLKRLRAAGRALGRVRDLDVILEKAAAYVASQPDEARPGLQPLVQYWEDERDTARSQMLEYLNSDKYQRFKTEFNTFVQIPGLGVQPVAPDRPAVFMVKDVAPGLVYARLEAVRAYETVLRNASIAQLHALRIEFKKLRYTVEFFREVLGEQAKAVIEELKRLQDHLGDLHDADVACVIINDFLEQWDAQQAAVPLIERRSPEPIVGYLGARYAERHHLLMGFPQAWERFNQPEFRQNLALAVAGL
jgi:CHAD domain-containing protein/transposase-like protein